MLQTISRYLIDRTTIRVQITIITAFLSIAAVAAAATGAASVARHHLVEASKAELSGIAKSMADRLDLHMYDRYREITNLGRMAPLKQIWDGKPEQAREILTQLQNSLPEYAWLGFATPEGTVKAATKTMLEGVSVAKRPWFIAGLESATVRDVHEAKLLDKLMRTSPDEPPFRFVDIAVPIYSQPGQISGVLGAHLSWEWAAELRRKVLSNHDTVADLDLFVIGRDGQILTGAASAQTTVALPDHALQDGEILVDGPAENAFLTAFSTTEGMGDYPGLGWTVAARLPLAVVEAPALLAAQRIFIIGIVIAFAVSALSWLLAGSVTGPLQRLTAAIDKVGRDPLVFTVDHQRGSKEVVQLSAALRSLMRRVGIAEHNEQAALDTVDTMRYEAALATAATERLDDDIKLLKSIADTDVLTGLLNRRAFMTSAHQAMAEVHKGRTTATIAMIDIDFFKGVNDTFGRAAGDQVIRMVASILSASVRKNDRVARFGGEEFVVLLRGVDIAGAQFQLQRIRETIATRLIQVGHDTINITVSGGLAQADDADRDIDDVIANADQALYRAKHTGRNRIETYVRSMPDLMGLSKTA